MQPRGAASSMQAAEQARAVARTAPAGLPGRCLLCQGSNSREACGA